MARPISVLILGDSRSLERAFYRSSKSAARFNRDMSKMFRGAAAGSGVFRGLGRSLAFASGGFLAFSSASALLRDSIDAARGAAVAQRSLAAQLKANGESWKANRDQVERVAFSYGKFGFANEEVVQSLTVLDRATGNITKATRLQTLAAEIARVKNIDLAAAAAVVGKVFGGQETALRRAVPGLSKNAKGMDLIREAQRKLAGQAAANTTAAERFHAILHNTEEIIGAALLPVLNRYLNVLGGWLEKMDRSGRLQRNATVGAKLLTDAFAAAKAVLTPLIDAFKTLSDAVGGTKNALVLLGATFAAFKFAALAKSFGLLTTGIAETGAAATTATGEVAGLRTALGGIAALSGITIALEVLIHRKEITDKARDLGIPFADKSGLDLVGMLAGKLGGTRSKSALVRRFAGENQTHADLVGDSLTKSAKTIANAIRKARDTITKAASTATAGPMTKERRGALIDLLQFRIDQAQATPGIADDLRALHRLETFLKRQIALHKTNLDLQKQLLAVQGQIADVLARRAEQQAARRKQRAERAARARDAAQFGRLGLGPTGEPLVPGVALLQRRLLGLRDAVKGTFLDTDKTKGLLANIETVLSGRLGKISAAVRAKIAEILANMRAQLKQHVERVDRTAFVKTNADALTAGLGLSREQRRRIRERFAAVGPGGVVPRGGVQFAHAGAVTVYGGVHLHGVQDVKKLEQELMKRSKQRAHGRRAPR